MLIANRFSASSIPSSVINSSGQFTYPTFYRVGVEFQEFDQFGNILETTSSDGIKSVFTYDSTGTLMLTNTLNPGAWQFKTQMNYIPLVGIIEKIDPNNFSTKIEYDYNNRPRIIRDHDDFILERIRYNYPNETANFALVSNKNQVLVNEQLVFEIQDVVLPMGGNYTIAWNMGNGSTFNDNRQSVTFSYSSPGLYTIIATMTSDNYPSINQVFHLLVNSPLGVSICADGPLNIDVCGTGPVTYGNCTVFNTSPFNGTEFIAQLDGPGCVGFYNYHWEYKRSDHFFWTTFGNGSDRAFFNEGSVFQPANYEIRCTVTDACNSSTVSYSHVYFYESSPACGGGFGGLSGESDGQNN